jgi:transposase
VIRTGTPGNRKNIDWEEYRLDLYCGIDWAEGHHDVAIVNDAGDLLAKRRIADDAAGYRALMELLAEHGDTPEDPIPVAIETSHGLLVAALRTGARKIYAVNPLSAARYRDRHGVSRKKSDPGDALVLANILRTDAHAHRPLPADTDQARAVTVLARAQQDAVWSRQQMANQLRSVLRLFYPALLEVVSVWQNGIIRPETRELLRIAPTPSAAARLTTARIEAALRRAGRSCGIATEAQRIKAILRGDHAREPKAVEDAMGHQASGLLLQLDAACQAVDQLTTAVEEAFLAHPDAQILLSFPGVGTQLGARILAEIGDDRNRFSDARALKAYAGSAPITRASGKKRFVGRRFVKNDRLNAAGYMWALSALTASSGARAHYQRRRDAGDWHAAAQRNLFNRFLGQLHHCLITRTRFDEATAFIPPAVNLAA